MITRCRSCNSPNLKDALTLSEPFVLCRECTLIQMKDTPNVPKPSLAPDGKQYGEITIALFNDIEDPNAFLETLRALLHPDGVLTLEQPYLLSMMQDLVVEPHVCYYTLTSLEPLLRRHGLEVTHVDKKGTNFIVKIKHMDAVSLMRMTEERIRLDSHWTYFLFEMEMRKR